MTRPALSEIIAARASDRPVLLSGGAVVTMDPDVPDLDHGDILIRGGHILALGADLRSAPEHAAVAAIALLIDTRGAVVSPGFVDTHRHAWQSQLRRSIPDVNDLSEYLASTLLRIAPHYTPDDMFIGTKLAALAALDGGITTMLDFSHNSRSIAHTDAAVDALVEGGIRGIHASMGPHYGEWDRQWPADISRIASKHHGAANGRITVRLAALATEEIAGPAVAYDARLAAVARDHGLLTSIDGVFGLSSSEAILAWEKAGLLDRNLTLIHATGLTTDAWRAMGDAEVNVSLAPTSDAQIGLDTAIPAIDEALAVGIRPGLSIDVEVALSGDMFTQMRALLAIQRMRAVNAVYGTDAAVSRITTRDVLDFATLQGARANGLGATTGSITPGKQADLIIVRADDINNMPLNDAVGTLVLGSDARNIETVFVAGRPRKWDGALVGVDLEVLRADVVASRDAVLSRSSKH